MLRAKEKIAKEKNTKANKKTKDKIFKINYSKEKITKEKRTYLIFKIQKIPYFFLSPKKKTHKINLYTKEITNKSKKYQS